MRNKSARPNDDINEDDEVYNYGIDPALLAEVDDSIGDYVPDVSPLD